MARVKLFTCTWLGGVESLIEHSVIADPDLRTGDRVRAAR